MTKKAALLRALNDIDEATLSDALAYRAPALRRLPRWIPAVAAAILVLTVGAAAALSWDSRFLDLLSPTEAIMEKYEGMLDPVQATEVYDDLTLTVTQTLGDAFTLYIAVDVQFTGINLADYAFPDDSGEPELSLILANPAFYQVGTKTERDEKDHRLGDGMRWTSAYADLDTNSVQFLVTIQSEDADLQEHPIRLEIDGIDYSGPGLLVEGPFSITWEPGNNIGTYYEWKLMEDDEIIGRVQLSPLSLHIDMMKKVVRERYDLPKIPNAEEDMSAYISNSQLLRDTLRSSIHIVMKDGSEFTQYGGLGGSGGTGYLDITRQFHEILDLDEVAYLEVAGYRLELE